MDTLHWLSDARSNEPIDVYMTNRRLKNGNDDLTKGLDDILKHEAENQSAHHYHFREEGDLSVMSASERWLRIIALLGLTLRLCDVDKRNAREPSLELAYDNQKP